MIERKRCNEKEEFKIIIVFFFFGMSNWNNGDIFEKKGYKKKGKFWKGLMSSLDLEC